MNSTRILIPAFRGVAVFVLAGFIFTLAVALVFQTMLVLRFPISYMTRSAIDELLYLLLALDLVGAGVAGIAAVFCPRLADRLVFGHHG